MYSFRKVKGTLLTNTHTKVLKCALSKTMVCNPNDLNNFR